MHTQKCNLFSTKAEGPQPLTLLPVCAIVPLLFTVMDYTEPLLCVQTRVQTMVTEVCYWILLGSLHQTRFIMHCTDHRYL